MRFFTFQLGGSAGTPVDVAGAYADADVLFAATPFHIKGLTNVVGKRGIIRSVNVIDRHAQAPEFDIVIFKGTSAPTLAALNAAWTLGAEDAANVIGSIQVLASTYTEAVPATGGNIRTNRITGLDLHLTGVDKRGFWAAGLSRGTPDYSSSGEATDLSISFHIEADT